MKCAKCNKICMESELIDGYCYECRNIYKEENFSKNDDELKNVLTNLSNNNCNENATSKKLTFIINATWILSIIFSLILGFYLIANYEPIIGIVTMIVLPFLTWLSTIVLESFREIINLLQDFKNK